MSEFVYNIHSHEPYIALIPFFFSLVWRFQSLTFVVSACCCCCRSILEFDMLSAVLCGINCKCAHFSKSKISTNYSVSCAWCVRWPITVSSFSARFSRFLFFPNIICCGFQQIELFNKIDSWIHEWPEFIHHRYEIKSTDHFINYLWFNSPKDCVTGHQWREWRAEQKSWPYFI